jgi:hypothetical protein
VAFPAYSETAGKMMVRNMDIAAKRANVSPDVLADVMLKLEVGDELTASDAEVLNAVITKLSPQPEAVEEEVVEETTEEAAEEVIVEPDLSAGMLELKKKKLEQLLKRI